MRFSHLFCGFIHTPPSLGSRRSFFIFEIRVSTPTVCPIFTLSIPLVSPGSLDHFTPLHDYFAHLLQKRDHSRDSDTHVLHPTTPSSPSDWTFLWHVAARCLQSKQNCPKRATAVERWKAEAGREFKQTQGPYLKKQEVGREEEVGSSTTSSVVGVGHERNSHL